MSDRPLAPTIPAPPRVPVLPPDVALLLERVAELIEANDHSTKRSEAACLQVDNLAAAVEQFRTDIKGQSRQVHGLADAVQVITWEVSGPPINGIRGLRVLYVEDEPMLLTQAARTFGSLGIALFLASSYDEAEMVLRHNTVDVALIDVALGFGRSGLDLGYELRKREQHRQVAIGFLTGRTPTGMDEHASALRAEVFEKPAGVDGVMELFKRAMHDRRVREAAEAAELDERR